MKKSAKIVLIIAGSCIVMGIALFIAGAAALSNPFHLFYEEKVTVFEDTMLNEKIEIQEEFVNIKVKEISGDIRLEVTDDDHASIEFMQNKKTYCTVEVKNDTLYIQRNDTRKWYDFIQPWIGDAETVIYLPKADYRELSLETGSGDILVKNSFQYDQAELSTVSGDISFTGAVKSMLDVQGTSGDISISGIDAGEIKAKTTSGDLEASEIICGTAQLRSGSGDIAADDISAERSISLKTVSGGIKFNALKAKDISMETTSGDIRGTIEGPMVYYTDTTSGDISVPPADNAGGECRVNTVSGDIRINRID